MKVLFGENDIIRAVTRVGTNRDQIAAWSAQSVTIWTGDNLEVNQSLPTPNDGHDHSALTVSANGEWLVGYGGDTIHCWRLVQNSWQLFFEEMLPGLCLARFTAAPAALNIVFLTDGNNGSVSVRIVKRSFTSLRAIPNDVDLATFPVDPWTIPSAAEFSHRPYRIAEVSPDGQWLMLSGGEAVVYVWNARTGEFVGSVGHRSTPTAGAFSNDGSMLAVYAGANVFIYRTQTLERIAVWKGKYSYAQFAWSPDDRWLARVDGTSIVRLFHVAKGQVTTTLAIKGQRGTAIHFSPDGLTFLVGTFKGSVVIWDMDE